MVFRTISRIIAVIWSVIGALILLWTGYWYFKLHIINDIGGVIVLSLFMGIGLYALMFYIPITLILVLLYFIIKNIGSRKAASKRK